MTEAYRVKTGYAISKWNASIISQNHKDWNDLGHDNKNRYVDSLKVFYLNPEKLSERRKEIKIQFTLSGFPEEQIERVEPTKYPCVADYT